MLGQLWRIYLLHTPGIAGRTLRSSTRRCSSRDFRLGSLRTVAVVWVVRYVLVLEIHTMKNLWGWSGIIGKTEIPSLFQYNFSTLQGSANVQLLTRQNPPVPELKHTRYDCTSILHGQLGSSKFSLETGGSKGQGMLGQDRAGLNLQTPHPLAACMLLILKMDSFCGNGRDTTGRH